MLPVYFFLYRLRFVCSGVLVVIAALLIIAAVAPKQMIVQASSSSNANTVETVSISDSPNAVTATMAVAAYKLNIALDGAVRTTGNGLHIAATSVSNAAATAARGVVQASIATASAVASAARFIVHIHVSTYSAIATVPSAAFNTVIKPADHNPVPIIDPNSPALIAAKEALPSNQPSATPASPNGNEAVWPIRGLVTTQFGDHGWAYATVHTGIDISDGKAPGVTPVTAFRRGVVITAERSGGLGNHVVVDHGSGVTSVYGHLHTIDVSVGQAVNTSTMLGYEGTTGVSTGTHLHFEIRVNGQATDPRHFINGQP